MKPIINIETKYKPKDKKELKDLICDPSIKLYEIDTSLITEMHLLFRDTNRTKNKDFEGIELWNVSNVKDMAGMFFECKNFNQPLNNWDVSNVADMSFMFSNCKKFNQPLNNWNVSNVCHMSYMFEGCKIFNQQLSNWNTSNTETRINMFKNCYIKEEYKPKG